MMGIRVFDRMTPSQRLAWLDEATIFVFNQGAATNKKKTSKLKSQ